MKSMKLKNITGKSVDTFLKNIIGEGMKLKTSPEK